MLYKLFNDLLFVSKHISYILLSVQGELLHILAAP